MSVDEEMMKEITSYFRLGEDLIKVGRQNRQRRKKILDRRRNENFLEVNPQYTEWFEEIRSTIGNYEKEEVFFRDQTIPLPIDDKTGETFNVNKLI